MGSGGDPPVTGRWRAFALVGTILAGTAFDAVTGGDHWPFSSYPMFAELRPKRRIERQLVGVRASAGDAGEIVLSLREIPLLDPVRAIMTSEKSADRPALERALAECLDRYEARRREGRHRGPPLGALRLYRTELRYDPGAPDLVTREPRKLMAEARR